jgi:hypothetical protein
MNKKLHFLLFGLAVIFILYLCKDKLLELFGKLEPFGNQIIIHPDNAGLNPKETTFSVLTYDSDLGSGVTQASTCSDDSSWRMGEKTCRDYSLTGSNCEDIGSGGKSAFESCKVACDNCNTYTEVKRRLPSPIEDTDEPSYAQFEGSMSSGDMGSDIGGPDYREILGKLDDLSGKMDLIENSEGQTAVTCTSDDTPQGCTPPPCTNDVGTPYFGCDATCTDIETPFPGCTQAACTDDADTPYTGCVTTCTAVNTPYIGCTPPECTTNANTPYTGCTPAACTTNANTPYTGCTPAQCTTNANTPYAGCTPAQCTSDANTPYTGCTPAQCTSDANTPYAGCTPVPCTDAANTLPYPGCTP